MTEIGGALVSSKIELSIIEDKHRFLSGCALAIRELFFNRGGLIHLLIIKSNRAGHCPAFSFIYSIN